MPTEVGFSADKLKHGYVEEGTTHCLVLGWESLTTEYYQYIYTLSVSAMHTRVLAHPRFRRALHMQVD